MSETTTLSHYIGGHWVGGRTEQGFAAVEFFTLVKTTYSWA